MKLWKILLPLTLCLVLAVLFLPTTANAASSGTCGENLTWTLDDAGTLTISGTGPMKDYTSASSVPWYSNRSSIKTVVIEAGVTTIGRYAFYRCSSLTSVTIGNSVTTIGYEAFYNCSKLVYNTYDNGKYLGNAGNPYLALIDTSSTSITQCTIHPNTKIIAGGAFYDCSSLTSVTIPDSVTTIGEYAFYSCDSLTSVTIPDSVTTFGSSAFSGCSSLTSVTIPDSVTTISAAAFSSCDSLTSVTIPDSVTAIGGSAFSGCSSLTSVAIGNGVTTIGNYAFYNCDSLTSMTIPDSVSTIGSSAFADCSRLVYNTYDNGKYLGNAGNPYLALVDTSSTSITQCTIHPNTKMIAGGAFSSCDSLTGVTIPDSVTTIRAYAFSDCISLTDVWYTGSQTDRNKISIGSYNDDLTSATWHYDACPVGAEHTYDNACDTNCNVCKKTRTITHNYQWVVDRRETCVADGIKHEECAVCHVKRNEGTAIPATGKHTYQWVIARRETCGVDGVKHEECTVCQAKRNEGTAIPATGKHTYDNSCDTECNVCKLTRTIEHTYDNACDTICNICKFERTVPPHSYTLNGNHTCDICKYSKTPAAPALESKTNSSVTLVKTEGFEYSKDSKGWQTSNVFANLAPDTTYTFYQRVKASSVALVSEVSEGVSVTFKSAQTAPSAPIISVFSDTMVTLIPITGGEYSADGKTWQTSNELTGLTPGTKYTVYQRYAETATHEASNSTSTTVTMDKSKQMQIPAAPTVESVTASSVTLNVVEGCEYSKDGKNWQKSNTFSGLNCGTEYTFYQRYAENATHYAGKASQSVTAKTDKGTQSKPTAPTLASKTHNTVTLVAVDGYEYSRDGINWQASNVFTGLSSEMNYFFYQRKAETATHYASEISPSLIVKTDEEPDYIPGDLNGNEQLTTDDAVYLLLHVMFGTEDYPVPEGMILDFDGDSKVDTDDAVYLLLHVMFGEEDYPLAA